MLLIAQKPLKNAYARRVREIDENGLVPDVNFIPWRIACRVRHIHENGIVSDVNFIPWRKARSCRVREIDENGSLIICTMQFRIIKIDSNLPHD